MKEIHFQSGFSLVETLVAITLLLIVIVGPMTITMQTSKSSNFASEQVIAFFLAQEGIELVEKVRDDFELRHFLPTNDGDYLSNPWTNQFTNTTGTYRNCYINQNPQGCGLYVLDDGQGSVSTPVNCSTITNCRLKYDTTGNPRAYYKHSNAGGLADSPFTRVITLERINADEVRVVSKVTWRTGSLRAEQDVTVETRLFNVYGN